MLYVSVLKRFLPLLLLVSATAHVDAAAFKTEIIEYIDDIKVVAFIAESDIAATRQWNPDDGAPPLSIADLVSIVNKKIDAGKSQARIDEIELKEIPGHSHYWHYLVKIRNAPKQKPDFVVVLMDGRTIAAIREPESIK